MLVHMSFSLFDVIFAFLSRSGHKAFDAPDLSLFSLFCKPLRDFLFRSVAFFKGTAWSLQIISVAHFYRQLCIQTYQLYAHLKQRQRETKAAALADFGVHSHAPAMRAHKSLGQKKAESRPAPLIHVCLVDLLESKEDRVKLVVGDANA